MTRKIRTWVLVADGSTARIFETGEPGEGLKEILHRESPRDRTRDIVSDRQGRHQDGQGGGHHAMDPRTDPRRHAEQEFARALCRILDREATAGAFDRLVLTAAPRTLGDLREMLSDTVRQLVDAEIGKDFIHMSPHELVHHLADVVRP